MAGRRPASTQSPRRRSRPFPPTAAAVRCPPSATQNREQLERSIQALVLFSSQRIESERRSAIHPSSN